MIMPKSSRNLGCFTQKLCSLQNMYQMTSSALETDKQPLRKIVNPSHALPLRGFPWLFEDCSNTNGPSDIPTDKNQGGWSPMNEVPTRRHTSCWSAFPEIALSASQECDLVCGDCPILLEPLVISISPSATSEWCPELPQHCHITFLIHCLTPLIFVFKPIRADYAMFGNGYPCRALYWV